MDWSRSKTIFIFVFLILDVFLFSLYLNRHIEAQQVKVSGGNTIEARLKEDRITYNLLPTIETAPYISAKVMDFNKENLQLKNYQQITIENNNKLIVTLKEPVKLRNVKEKSSFNEFVKNNVYNGSSYTIWKIDEEERKAIFFQNFDDKTIYYNVNGIVTIYWNEDLEVTKYEQTMLRDFEKFEEEENLLPPQQIIQILYARDLIKPNSHIAEIKLGYSTLVQLTQTQVFVPTWKVRIIPADGEEEELFVNAVDGKMIDVQSDLTVDVDETDELEQLKEIEEE
ncbi:two-component system regulatory protein YycI [Ureibacillus sp. FSL K6-8385]|uniref:Transcriptional regulator n=1 Tax=Ureibacillus terrenus TaxID=118246 RepID=A0A540V2W1_9BACL|nr:two-component system regulatory protein YycI [Ureibacillus terrenus]MED3661638.1 two-component system regulatory protein YycI [Ureibacillus terrenus]MED3763600.1 two-component system regulatory protein YycI [Ureibacillus terrenus]TQE91084.1 transcriptional regulator [Ureibacillus terrenus]